MCPTIRKEGLRGAILYYDGQQNDARLVLVVALTAIREGAKVCLSGLIIESSEVSSVPTIRSALGL